MTNKLKNQEEPANNNLAIQGQFTQADIPTFLAQVDAKIKELTKGDKKEVVITVELPGFGNISKNESVMNLIQACSSVEGKEEAYKKAAAKYLPENVKTPPFILAGHSAKQWLDFISERIVEVAHKKELEKLRTIKSKLEENLSQEAKLANDLKAISNILMDN